MAPLTENSKIAKSTPPDWLLYADPLDIMIFADGAHRLCNLKPALPAYNASIMGMYVQCASSYQFGAIARATCWLLIYGFIRESSKIWSVQLVCRHKMIAIMNCAPKDHPISGGLNSTMARGAGHPACARLLEKRSHEGGIRPCLLPVSSPLMETSKACANKTRRPWIRVTSIYTCTLVNEDSFERKTVRTSTSHFF